jgi:TolB protein
MLMTRRTGRALRWLLCGGAFVAVIAASGCANHRIDRAQNETVPAKPQAESPNVLFDNSSSPPDKAPVVNVFGELDGSSPQLVRPASESGFQQHTFADEGYDNDAAVSPDGKWLAFASTRHNEHPDIYLQKVNGLSVTQLTSDEADDAFPTFSPDGKQIAFCSTRAGSWDIFLMDVDGRNITQLTSGPMQDLHPSFSPDGRRIAYCSCGGRSGQWELWTVDIESGAKKMIGQGLFPSFSPDKSVDRIAFQRARQRGSRWFSLWTLDLIDGEARRVTEIAVSSNAAVISPSWSPDGKRLAFATIVNPAHTSNGKPAGQQDIWVINADGSGRQRLTDGNGTNLTPFWSADGRVYFVSDRGGTECVWSVNANRETNKTMTVGTDLNH